MATCYQDSAIAIVTLTYSHTQNFVSTFPWLGGDRTDTINFTAALTLTRATLSGKGVIPPIESVDGLIDYLSDGEFFLLADCCCPCKWVFVAKFPDSILDVGTYAITIDYPAHPASNLAGTYQLDATLSFGLASNAICGRGEVYDPQSPYWPTFDGSTPPDPAVFTGDGIAFVLPTKDYSGSPALDGITQAPIESIVSPYNLILPTGYFYFYNTDLTAIDGVGPGGDNHGFREPCDVAMSFVQTVSWDMDRFNSTFGFDVNGTGSGTLTVEGA